jgi:hypothetical protein
MVCGAIGAGVVGGKFPVEGAAVAGAPAGGVLGSVAVLPGSGCIGETGAVTPGAGDVDSPPAVPAPVEIPPTEPGAPNDPVDPT